MGIVAAETAVIRSSLVRGFVIAVAVCALACANRHSYVCSSSDQCVLGGRSGVCEPTGFCSFDDGACPSGRKYEPNAGAGLGGTCVPQPPPPPVDAAVVPCGAVGESCCMGETAACVANAYCAAGTCQTCATAVSFGRRFSCILKHDGGVWCSGDNTVGQLGLGVVSMAPQSQFMQVRDSNAKLIADATAITAGREHACAVRGGNVWCWGANESGQLGNGATFPTPPATLPPSAVAVEVVKAGNAPLTNIVSVAGSYAHTCALDASGGVWCWGGNAAGTLGDGTTTGRTTAAPVLVAAGGAALAGASELQVGGGQTCVRKGPDIWCWGENGNGQMGNNSTAAQTVPLKVATTTSFATGMWTACFVKPDTSVACMGWGSKGRLGNAQGASFYGTDSHVAIPVLTAPNGPPLTGVQAVAAGAFGCAIMVDGGLQCWGDDPYGQTGTGVGSLVPLRVVDGAGMPITGVDAISAHFTHACAHTMRGELMCWGRGYEGEFGDGTFASRGFPTPLVTSCQ